GLVVVDFDILSSFGERYKPAWDGNWTLGQRKLINLPHKVTQIFTGEFNGVTRAFAFGLEVNDGGGYVNQLFELSLDDINDWDFPNGDVQEIKWELITRAFNFSGQSTPFNETQIYDADLWLRDVVDGSSMSAGTTGN